MQFLDGSFEPEPLRWCLGRAEDRQNLLNLPGSFLTLRHVSGTTTFYLEEPNSSLGGGQCLGSRTTTCQHVLNMLELLYYLWYTTTARQNQEEGTCNNSMGRLLEGEKTSLFGMEGGTGHQAFDGRQAISRRGKGTL